MALWLYCHANRKEIEQDLAEEEVVAEQLEQCRFSRWALALGPSLGYPPDRPTLTIEEER